MHSYGIAHRDLKLENIIMLDDTDESQLKIVDFGLSKMIGPNETASDPFGTLVSQLLILTSWQSYVAPEVLIQRPYGKNVDLWSLGVIIYVLLSGMLPFDSDDNKETARQTIYDPVPFGHKVWSFVSTEAKDLIQSKLTHSSYILLLQDSLRKIGSSVSAWRMCLLIPGSARRAKISQRSVRLST